METVLTRLGDLAEALNGLAKTERGRPDSSAAVQCVFDGMLVAIGDIRRDIMESQSVPAGRLQSLIETEALREQVGDLKEIIQAYAILEDGLVAYAGRIDP